MPSTYDKIEAKTVGSNTPSVTFTAIPNTYTDLVLVTNLATDAATEFRVRVGNGSIDTGSNYSMTYLIGTGSSAISSRESSQTWAYAGYTSVSALSKMHIFNFQNYSNTTTNKSWLMRFAGADNQTTAVAALWRSTSAINQIQLIANGNNIAAGSTMTLYGIKAA